MTQALVLVLLFRAYYGRYMRPEDLGMPFPGRRSSSDIETKLGIGQCRIESLGGRDRLQILPKGLFDDNVLPPTSTLPSAASVSCQWQTSRDRICFPTYLFLIIQG
jgi:hypothetical protein